jgi:exodeoxyribonuclease VII large subunit
MRRLRLARQSVGRAETALAAKHPRHVLRLADQRLCGAAERLKCAAAVQRERRRARVDALERELRAVSPEAVLRRGYSVTTLKKDGTLVRNAAQIKGGERLVTRLADGVVESVAEDPKQPGLF